MSTTPDRTLKHRLRRLLADNPVVLKELRGRMRGARAFIVLTIYLGLLGAFSSLIYVAVSESAIARQRAGECGRDRAYAVRRGGGDRDAVGVVHRARFHVRRDQR